MVAPSSNRQQRSRPQPQKCSRALNRRRCSRSLCMRAQWLRPGRGRVQGRAPHARGALALAVRWTSPCGVDSVSRRLVWVRPPARTPPLTWQGATGQQASRSCSPAMAWAVGTMTSIVVEGMVGCGGQKSWLLVCRRCRSLDGCCAARGLVRLVCALRLACYDCCCRTRVLPGVPEPAMLPARVMLEAGAPASALGLHCRLGHLHGAAYGALEDVAAQAAAIATATATIITVLMTGIHWSAGRRGGGGGGAQRWGVVGSGLQPAARRRPPGHGRVMGSTAARAPSDQVQLLPGSLPNTSGAPRGRAVRRST